MKTIVRHFRFAPVLIGAILSGCAPTANDLSLVEGPAIIDVVTPFDKALSCLDGKVDKRLGFAVGNIPDGTGREAYNDGGVGKFVTQSSGDIVQSALFKTGVKVINRRDMGTAALEAQWGIRSLKNQQNAHFAITGSVNSLDFIPGAGSYINIGGVGAGYNQSRILVGLDLAMTNVATGQVISNIALQKQIVSNDAGIFGTRYRNSKLIDSDIGGARREALNDALRSMLQLATFELMLQLMPPQKYEECMDLIDPRYGAIGGEKTAGEQYIAYRKEMDQVLEGTDNLSVDRGPSGESDEFFAPQAAGSTDTSVQENIPSSAVEASSNLANNTVSDDPRPPLQEEKSVPLYKRDDGLSRGR